MTVAEHGVMRVPGMTQQVEISKGVVGLRTGVAVSRKDACVCLDVRGRAPALWVVSSAAALGPIQRAAVAPSGPPNLAVPISD